MSCIEGKGGLKDIHRIAQNTALFVDLQKIKKNIISLVISKKEDIFKIENAQIYVHISSYCFMQLENSISFSG